MRTAYNCLSSKSEASEEAHQHQHWRDHMDSGVVAATAAKAE